MKKMLFAFPAVFLGLSLAACDTEEAVDRFEIIDRSAEDRAAYVHDDHWDGTLPDVQEGEHLSLGAVIEDSEGEQIELNADNSPNRLDVTLAEGEAEDIVELESHGDHVHISGLSEGTVDVTFQWLQDGEVRYTTPAITVEVGHGHDDDHEEIRAFEILDRGADEEKVAYVHDDHWHGELPDVPEGDNLSLGASIEETDETPVDLNGEDALGVSVYDDAPKGIVSVIEHGDHVHIEGEEEGITQVVFHWLHEDEIKYTTPPINVVVD